MTQSDPLINHIKPENILGVEYKPLYRLLSILEEEKKVVIKSHPGAPMQSSISWKTSGKRKWKTTSHS